jgi:DNA-directed RNA polymerase
MTNVYGVTFVGARSQIEGQLADREDIPEDLQFKYVRGRSGQDTIYESAQFMNKVKERMKQL